MTLRVPNLEALSITQIEKHNLQLAKMLGAWILKLIEHVVCPQHGRTPADPIN